MTDKELYEELGAFAEQLPNYEQREQFAELLRSAMARGADGTFHTIKRWLRDAGFESHAEPPKTDNARYDLHHFVPQPESDLCARCGMGKESSPHWIMPVH